VSEPEAAGDDRAGRPGGRHTEPNGIDARQAADRAMEYLSEVTGQEPEVVIAVEPDGDDWHVQLELLELARIPDTTDVLGLYQVDLGAGGEPIGHHRTGRYHRGHVGES